MKKSMYLLSLLAFTIFMLPGCFLLSPQQKEWTLMLYLDGDESAMQQDFVAAFHDMIAKGVGSSQQVNVVIQFDRIPQREDFGGWTIAHRFYYINGMAPTPDNAIADWGDGTGGREVNMSDPNTLSDFINWAHKTYPANNYALMVADHGYGWKGLMIDQTSDGDFMTLKQFAGVLENAEPDFDILMLNACLMQMIEVMYEIEDSGINVVVGSENSGTSWPLSNIIETFSTHPDWTPDEFGTEIVDLYIEAHPGEDSITLSALNLQNISLLNRHFTDLVDTILSDDPFTTVQEKAQSVLDKLDETIIHKRNGADWINAGGLSLYWPQIEMGFMPQDFFYNYIPQNTSFSTDANWRDFLYIYYNPMSYEGVINGEIYQIRTQLKEFEDPNIDIYQFCKAITGYSE
ncbi:MAG TPA: clostripain-related cysteine peptidase [Thermotogota bacterium]|nr:clostripain-related cysteine peptidase [Thermotogota bacterium]HRW35225.1 clostripain-related cysteine peptidase [Thermotogota bacterium]